jgi:glutamine synthetase
LKVERHHHEVATAGQTEIDLKFAPMIQMADWMQIYKYIVKNVAAKHGKTATFMPKPLFEDNGSGMHVHQSLWKDGKPLFAGDKYAGLSQEALFSSTSTHCWPSVRRRPTATAVLCPATRHRS